MKKLMSLILMMVFVCPSPSWAFGGAGYSLGQRLTAVSRNVAGSDIKARSFEPHAMYAVCFTPGQDCQGFIVKRIEQAKSQILVQAYSFTSAPIAKALVEAKGRGLEVKVILDKSQRSEKYTGATFLKNSGIPVVIDEKPAIAHSKVMILDQATVITGSFNFTKAAQEKNSENVILIEGDKALAYEYLKNWNSRWSLSVEY